MLAYTLLDFPWVSLYFLSGWQIPFQALLEHLTPCVPAGCACRDSSCCSAAYFSIALSLARYSCRHSVGGRESWV